MISNGDGGHGHRVPYLIRSAVILTLGFGVSVDFGGYGDYDVVDVDFCGDFDAGVAVCVLCAKILRIPSVSHRIAGEIP